MRYRITITIDTPSVSITQIFNLKDYDSPEAMVKAAKDWIRKDE